MKSWRFNQIGPIENLRLGEIPQPVPAAGEALVRLKYAALNPADRYLVAGKYPRAGKPPFAVGRDGCGVIEQAAAGSRFKTGDEVVLLRSEVGVSREGTLAEYVTVPEESLAPLPAGWSPEQGAAGPLVLLTAWQALVEEGGLKPGGNVLITGATGGVGTAALLLARALGAKKVVGLSRNAEKGKLLLELGADAVLDPNAPDVVDQCKAAMDGGRADVVVENIAGPQLQKSILMTGFKGRVCVVGLLGGLKSEVEIAQFLFKRIHIIGISMGSVAAAESQENWRSIVATLDKAGTRPPIDRVFGFGEVQEAFARLAEGPLGKVLVKIA